MSDKQEAASLDPGEISALDSLRRVASELTMEIGSRYIDLQRVLTAFSDNEKKAQGILMRAGKRLKIPEGTTWTVTDGKVYLMTDNGPVGYSPPQES